MRRQLGASAYAGLLFTALGVVAWGTGQPFVFPSLGPSAFVLAFERGGERTRPRRVVGGHLLGGVAGLVCYALLVPDVSMTAVPPALSAAGLRLAASGVCSVVLTSWAMMVTDTVHPPACATTLIVSLGLLSTPRLVGIVVVSVTTLVGVHTLGRRVRDWVDLEDPERSEGHGNHRSR